MTLAHTNRVGRLPATLLLVALAATIGVVPASEQDLGTFRDWRAHTFAEGESLVCSMWSQPTKAEGKYSRRGEIFAFVTHRPAEKRNHKVSFEMGYDFQADKPLLVTIDDKRFELVTSGSTAWSDRPRENQAILQLMKAGTEMQVTGVSERGTRTTDTYSLLGFTAAYRRISEACDVT